MLLLACSILMARNLGWYLMWTALRHIAKGDARKFSKYQKVTSLPNWAMTSGIRAMGSHDGYKNQRLVGPSRIKDGLLDKHVGQLEVLVGLLLWGICFFYAFVTKVLRNVHSSGSSLLFHWSSFSESLIPCGESQSFKRYKLSKHERRVGHVSRCRNNHHSMLSRCQDLGEFPLGHGWIF